MIGYEIDIGFAIGRLVSVFYDMARAVTGDSRRVHFSFARIGSARSNVLPADFGNLIEFDLRRPTPEGVAGLLQYVRRQRIDWVFALDLSVSAPYLPALRAAGVKCIVSYWGAPMSSLNRGLKLLLKRLEIALLRRARPDHFIFESRAMQRFAVDGRGVPDAQTTVIYTGVDAARFRPDPSSAALVYERFAIPRHRRIIVFMGHLHARKGVHVLMRAAGHLARVLGRADVHVLFLGNRGDEVEKFRDDFAAGSEYITFGGYHTDIPALLSGCYAGCIPSTGWDSFPMSSLEMQACGLPVLVSDWQGVPETVADEETGVVVTTGDAVRLAEAIAALVDDPERRQRMSSAARMRIEGAFTREHQLENLVRYLRQQGL
jgi:glycosyltransferase involved in cell wall biosynthesis